MRPHPYLVLPLAGALLLGVLGCRDREKHELRMKTERQASQLRRVAEALGEARADLDRAELSLTFVQAEARNPLRVHEGTAAAREALRKVKLRLKEAQDGVK